MEKSKQTPNATALITPQSGSLITSDHCKRIVKVVAHVNMFTDFPKTGPEILDWARDIERLAPNATVEEIAFLMDQFKTGDADWDKQEGITNIFRGLKRVRRDENGQLYFIKRFL